MICLETEKVLSTRLLETLSPDDLKSSSTKSGHVSLPTLFDPQPLNAPILWRLPSWQHLKWTMHALAPVFALNLDSIQSISNSVKIYCLWLKNPQARPSCVTPEYLEEFISFILYDLTEVFVPRKLPEGKSSSNSSNNTLGKRHVELCQLILNTVLSDAFLSTDLFAEFGNSIWNLLTRVILGISDNLLWRDTANYLSDDLAELLLNSCFFMLLKSEIYSDALWRKFSSCFKLWCHRVKSILVWGSVLEALNNRAYAIIHSHSHSSTSSSDSGSGEILFGLHSTEFKMKISDKFAIFCWAHITNLLPIISSLSADLFLRALQSLEKISSVWLLGPDTSIPDANTLFEVYGEYIFEAVSIDKPSHEAGRAIAISILCKILSKRQYRTEISDQYLTFSFSCIKKSLSAPEIHTVASTILFIGDVLTSNLPGVRCLLIPIFTAIHRIIPKLSSVKFPSISVNHETLRLKCYQLLSFIYPFLKQDIIASGNNNNNNIPQFPSLNSPYSQQILQCYQQQQQLPSNKNDGSVSLKASLMDTLISTLLIEESANNVLFILNLSTSILYSDHQRFPALIPTLSTIFVELLCKEKFSSIDVQILIIRILQQISGFGLLESAHLKRFSQNLVSFARAIHSRSNLTVNFRLLLSLYDILFDWLVSFVGLSSTCSSSISTDLNDCIQQFISILIKFMNNPNNNSAGSNLNLSGNSNNNNNNNNSSVSKRQSVLSQRPSSPPVASSFTLKDVYGLKCRKSLSERVFSLEVGPEDPRPYSLSPTLLKGIDEIFLEYTDTTVQRLLNLLFQLEFQPPHDIKESENFKYFALSTSTVVGYFEDVLIVRCPSGKFHWKIAEHHLDSTQSETETEIEKLNLSNYKESSIIILDNETIVSKKELFSKEVAAAHDYDTTCGLGSDVLLNETNWMKTVDMIPITYQLEFESVLTDAQEHFTVFLSDLEKKSQFSQLGPQSTQDSTDHLTRLLLTNMGFLTPATRSLLNPIDWSESFSLDLLRLDSLPNREQFSIPVYFTIQNDQSQSAAVSASFERFFVGLNNSNSPDGSLYSDSSIEVLFRFTQMLTNSNTNPNITPAETGTGTDENESISIIWSEDIDDDHHLDLDKLPPQSASSFVFIVISPVLIGNEVKGEYFRIKFLFTPRSVLKSVGLSLSIGPIVDGMIVEKNSLSRLIRDTAISAHLFISHHLQNAPSPIMQRQHFLKSIVFKNYKNHSFGSLIRNIL